jgi:multimeric flavodoxin WrbA
MAQKNIVVVMGSPRKKGNSVILSEKAIAGARDAGAKVDSYVIHEMDARPCSACEGCRQKVSAPCVLKDDLTKVLEKVREADALIIASPIYWFNLSAQTKLFIDRWYSYGGDDSDNYALMGKELAIILTYAEPDPLASGAINALRSLEDCSAFVGAKIKGVLHGAAWEAGEIEKNKELLEKAYALGKALAS